MCIRDRSFDESSNGRLWYPFHASSTVLSFPVGMDDIILNRLGVWWTSLEVALLSFFKINRSSWVTILFGGENHSHAPWRDYSLWYWFNYAKSCVPVDVGFHSFFPVVRYWDGCVYRVWGDISLEVDGNWLPLHDRKGLMGAGVESRWGEWLQLVEMVLLLVLVESMFSSGSCMLGWYLCCSL